MSGVGTVRGPGELTQPRLNRQRTGVRIEVTKGRLPQNRTTRVEGGSGNQKTSVAVVNRERVK